MVERFLVSLLLKLGVMASIASILARSSTFKSMLMLENRTLHQRLIWSIWLSVVFGASVATRVIVPLYEPADLGLEGSLLAGILGGYVTGLVSGILIALPALFKHEYLAVPLLAGVGVLGGLVERFLDVPAQGYTHLEEGLRATLQMVRGLPGSRALSSRRCRLPRYG